MHRVPFSESVRIIGRGVKNWFTGHPIVVSFEVTDSCTCYCKHCDHGGPRDTSENLKPEQYRRYVEMLNPCVVQVSGGEPLMRKDIVDIVRNIKQPTGLPYTILVSNWSNMTEEKYHALREAGVNQFSVSLDFPDERHDDFRGLPGLYKKLNELMPKFSALGHDDIVLNNCITSVNLHEIENIANKAREWGVNVSFSAYTQRRTGNRDYFITRPEDLKELKERLDKIKQRMDSSKWILNSRTTIDATYDYFEKGCAPGCKAGYRFLVVTANGKLQPCSMQFVRFEQDRHAEMVEKFTNQNTCDECYVSIRSYLDKTLPRLMYESISGHFSFRSQAE